MATEDADEDIACDADDGDMAEEIVDVVAGAIFAKKVRRFKERANCFNFVIPLVFHKR